MKPAILRSWFTWWFVLVFPMCPIEAYVHVMAFITIAYVHCEKRYNVRMQLSQTVMPVFRDDGVFHTVADTLSQSHWWWHLWHVWSVSLCEDCYIRDSEWPGQCHIRSRALREASPDFNSHRKSLLKINAIMLTIFKVTDIFQLSGWWSNTPACAYGREE